MDNVNMSDISALKAKQDAMAEDMLEVKDSLKGINKALNLLARLEEKHTSTQETILRIHGRIDNHSDRIRANENKLAAQMWVERMIWVVVAGVISIVVSKGLV